MQATVNHWTRSTQHCTFTS